MSEARARRMSWTGALLLTVIAGAFVLGCSDQEEQGGAGASASGGETSRLEAAVEEEADLDGVKVLVSSLGPVARPALPDATLQSGTLTPPSDSVFYQARLLVTNASEHAAWVDPADFALVAGDQRLFLDPTRSGPRPRALLPTASLGLVLTFPGPADLSELVLEYRPDWYRAGLDVRGDKSAETGDTAATD